MPLVCKAFARAAEWCWDHLHVDGLQLGPTAPTAAAALEFWSRLAAWAARRAAAISSLRLSNLRHLLRELDEEQRRAALAQLWAALAPGGGGGSPRIHTLHLGRSSVALGPGTLADMAALASLHSVTVHSAGPMDWSELDVLAGGLPCLEQLTVCLMRQRGVHCAFRGAFPAALTRLPRLRALCLEAPYSALGAPLCVLPEGIAAWAPQVRGAAPWLLPCACHTVAACTAKVAALRAALPAWRPCTGSVRTPSA